MKIIGGADRGRRLAAPRGRETRPTAGRVREALFDIVGPRIRGARVLDLFAGTGAVGLEALSRGAARAVFVEHDRTAVRALRANLAALSVPRARARVVVADAVAAIGLLGRTEVPFDLVFLDPPYASDLARRALAALAGSAVLGPGALAVVQHFAKTPAPTSLAGFRTWREPRRFGETTLTFLEAEGYTPPGSRP
jgi:16S rRNA (guanine966-N2)-methyltransferase